MIQFIEKNSKSENNPLKKFNTSENFNKSFIKKQGNEIKNKVKNQSLQSNLILKSHFENSQKSKSSTNLINREKSKDFKKSFTKKILLQIQYFLEKSFKYFYKYNNEYIYLNERDKIINEMKFTIRIKKKVDINENSSNEEILPSL